MGIDEALMLARSYKIELLFSRDNIYYANALHEDGRHVFLRIYAKRELLVREVRALTLLNGHASICKYFAAIEAEEDEVWHNCCIVVTERGQTRLNYLLDEHDTPPWSLTKTRSLIVDMARALIHCHAHRVVQFNLRPYHIMYFGDYSQQSGCWKIMNFDQSRMFGEPCFPLLVNHADPLLATSLLLGKAAKAHPSMDVFALGRLLQHILVGKDAFYPLLGKQLRVNYYDALSYIANPSNPLWEEEGLVRESRLLLGGLLQREPLARLSLPSVERYFSGQDNASLEGEEKSTTFTTQEEFGVFHPSKLVDSQVLGNQYQLERCAGTGGFAVVWQATDTDTQTMVALKFYQEQEYFIRETTILRQLKHPNIIDLIDSYEQDSDTEWFPYALVVMPLGIHTLHEHARFQRPLRIAKLKVIMEDIVDAMECLDKHHIVHCDLKPGNVMLFREHNQVERWKLIDFDSSAVVGDAVDRGTLEYCAPEVIAANATRQPIQAAHSMDMYALGRILLWLSSDSEHLWPDCSEHASDQDKQAFLQSESEFTITEQLVSHAPTRHVVVSLLRKNPMERMTLERLRASSFVQMNLDTRVLAI